MQMKKGMIRILIPILDQSLRMHDILLHVQLTKKWNETKFRIKRINSYHQKFSRAFHLNVFVALIKMSLFHSFIIRPHNDYPECCLYHTKIKTMSALMSLVRSQLVRIISRKMIRFFIDARKKNFNQKRNEVRKNRSML